MTAADWAIVGAAFAALIGGLWLASWIDRRHGATPASACWFCGAARGSNHARDCRREARW